MSSSDYHPAPRRRRRSRPALKALKLAVPFLLLIAVGLLSAGVIRLVETTAAAPIPTKFDFPQEQERERESTAPRQGWGALRTPFESNIGLRSSGDFSVQLDGILPTSFLESTAGNSATTHDPIPHGEHGFEGPGAMRQAAPSDARLVPEPRTAVLVAMGLCCMSIRRRF